MQKLRIISVDTRNGLYDLRDEENGACYRMVLEFWDVANPPERGDWLFWGGREKPCDFEMRTYGPYSNELPFLRRGDRISGEDLLIVVKPEQTLLLHRYYG